MQEELWDIYDADRNKTGRTHRRGEPIPPGDYHLVVHIWVMNSKGDFFITRRAPEKKVAPLIWESPGGSALAGEDSLTAARREAKEETGFDLLPENGRLVFSIRREDNFADVWLFRQEVDLAQFVSQPGETIDGRLAAPEEILAMVRTGAFFRNPYMEELFLYAEILAREEMLICPPPGMARDAIEGLLARDFFEIGASCGLCDRDAAIDTLVRRSLAPPNELPQIAGYELRRLSESICLAVYTLTWGGHTTRRSTIWRREGDAWRAVYHQGTRCSSCEK